MQSASSFIFTIAIIIMSVVIHEVSHGFMALALGDKTAKFAGRLTLNPLPHIDIFGSILLPLFAVFMGVQPIAYAKPVPYNPYNLRNQRWGPALVGVAGPLANVIVALFFGLIIRLHQFFPATAFYENMLGVFQLIVVLNVWLALFNLLPLPPLDGSKVLFSVLPYQFRSIQYALEQYGMVLLFGFIILAPGIISYVLWPIVEKLFLIITGL